jgi:6-pyruvoyltetrahydropterin/6-carboxytetrahydropterin synthase
MSEIRIRALTLVIRSLGLDSDFVIRISDFAAPFPIPPAVPRIPPLMRVRLSKTFHFEAAHDLPTFPADHKCRRLHGHSFRFDVIVEGEVAPEKGYLIDYGDIKKAVEPLVSRLDHFYLNDIEGLSNPTAENLARWIFERLKAVLPLLKTVIIRETCTSACEYSG